MHRITLPLSAIAWLFTAACAPPPPPSLLDATVVAAPAAPAMSDWSLLTSQGEAFTEYDLAGHWTIAFVGYLTCPDVCPTTMSSLARVREALGDAMPEVIFITVDPERDTPERLASYGAHFDPRITLLRAEGDALAHAVQQLGAAWEGPHPDGRVDHSTSLFLVDPGGRVHSYLLRAHDPEQLVQDIQLATATQPEVAAELWAPPTPPGAMSAAAYGTIHSLTGTHRLVEVHAPGFPHAHLHQTTVEQGMARMQSVDGGWPIAPESPLELVPGGHHLMLMGGGVEAGPVPLRLIFDDTEVVAVAQVRER